jgi:hypothetical protein
MSTRFFRSASEPLRQYSIFSQKHGNGQCSKQTKEGISLIIWMIPAKFVFPPNNDLTSHPNEFDEVLITCALSRAPDKDLNGTVITHLGFELDSINIKVRHRQAGRFACCQIPYGCPLCNVCGSKEVLGFVSYCC